MYDSIEETILIVPNSGLRLSLLIRNDDKTFKEVTHNDGTRHLKMLTSDYLSLSIRESGVFASVTVSYLCMGIFKAGMKECREFMEKAFECHDNCYYVKKDYSGGFKIEDLCNGRSLLFIPYVDNNTESHTSEPGVSIYFSNDISTFVSYESFSSLVDICLRFDLYLASKMLLNNALMYEKIKA